MKVALDTNVLAYAEGVNSGEKRDVALHLARQLPQSSVIIPVQVLVSSSTSLCARPAEAAVKREKSC